MGSNLFIIMDGRYSCGVDESVGLDIGKWIKEGLGIFLFKVGNKIIS